MINICVLGHSIDEVNNQKDTLLRKIDDMVVVLGRQYKTQINYLLTGEAGISQWFADACVAHNASFEMRLSSLPETYAQFCSKEQYEKFSAQLNQAKKLTICDNFTAIDARHRNTLKMVDDSQWTLAFWLKKHQGLTYDAIQHSINTNKIVINGFDFTMIIKE